MRTIKSLLVMTAIVGLVAMKASAGPLLPSFPTTWSPDQAIAGQSKLVNPLNLGDYINIDWIVLYDSTGVWGYPGAFVYMYQIENTAGSSGVGSLNIKYVGAQANARELGVKLGDLDVTTTLWTGHDATNFSNLADETEPGGDPVGGLGNYNWNFPDPNSVSFTGVGLSIAPTKESLVLYIIDPRPPVYGEARAQDSATWWGKVTLGGITYGDPVPVPSPEPGAAMLLVVGLMGALAWRYRRK